MLRIAPYCMSEFRNCGVLVGLHYSYVKKYLKWDHGNNFEGKRDTDESVEHATIIGVLYSI
jgi:hypothetical protein